MIDSFILSLFFFGIMVFQIIAYQATCFPDFSKGKKLALSKAKIALLLASFAVAVAIADNIILTEAGPQILQYFYYFIYTFGVVAAIVLMISNRYLRWTLLTVFAFIMINIIMRVPAAPWLQNFIMALSLLWVGPTVFKKFRIRSIYFLLCLAVFASVDFFNIYFAQPSNVFSDEMLVLNGMVSSGPYLLGVGDFLLAGLAVCFVLKYLGQSRAIGLALALALVRFLIRLLWPDYTLDIPYTLIIALATAIIGWPVFRSKARLLAR